MTGARNLWFFLAFALGLGILWQFVPLSNAQGRIHQLPLKGLGYQGKEIALDDFEKEFFKEVEVTKRLYEVGDAHLFLSIIDGTNNRHVVHDPYFCFAGAGWRVGQERVLLSPQGEIKKILLTKGDNQKEVLFWFSDGNVHFTSPIKYWMLATLRRLTLGASGEEPVLIILQSVNQDDVNWARVQKNFEPLFGI